MRNLPDEPVTSDRINAINVFVNGILGLMLNFNDREQNEILFRLKNGILSERHQKIEKMETDVKFLHATTHELVNAEKSTDSTANY